MKFKLVDCTDTNKIIELASMPLKISSKDTSKIFEFLDKRYGKFTFSAFPFPYVVGWVVSSSSYSSFIRAIKDTNSAKETRYWINVSSKDLFPKDILEIFNGILENGYILSFIDVTNKCSLEIKSLEELIIQMELER